MLNKILVILFGTLVTALIDGLLGIKFNGSPDLPKQVIHKIVYMAWGVLIWTL